MRKKYLSVRLTFANAQSGQCACCLASISFTANQERERFFKDTFMHRLIQALRVNNLLYVQKWLLTDTIDRSINSIDSQSYIHRYWY